MVGFIDPVGTSFQSASAERSELTIRIMRTKMRISRRTFFLSMAMALILYARRPENVS
jgi:hypothetical protein